MIAALLLAAGAGRRFAGAGGIPKLLERVGGTPIVRLAADALRGPPVAELVVVVPPEHDALRAALAGSGARLVVNPDPAHGMGASLACGAAALAEDVDAVLVALADSPFVAPATIERVVTRYRQGGVDVVVPTFHGTRGHPVLFARSVFPELLALTGDRGAREVTLRDPGRTAFVELDVSPPLDVDTAEDLAQLRGQAHHMAPRKPR